MSAAALVVVAGVLVPGCGSSTKSSSTPPPTGAPTTTPSGAPAPSAEAGAAPAVANASNLAAKPQVSAGTAPKPSQLVTKDLVVGTGAQATSSATVHVQYVGVNYDNGQEFDSSWSRGQPADFPLNGVIAGFSQGIVGMKVGGRRELVIPPALGYGARGAPPAVGPNETLVFVIDLLGVK
jgi:peptidylprolyl isomerase